MKTSLFALPALRIQQGSDCLQQLPRELDRLGANRAVIFCGTTLARDGSPLTLVRAALSERCAGVFSGVRAHSPLPAVEAGAQELRRLAADAVIAVGGGSAIVTARAASILLAEGKNIRSLCTSRDASGRLISPKLQAPKLPQLVVPTTPTTATVKAGSAVFDPIAKARLALFDPKTRAQAIFINPQLLASAPQPILISASFNSLTNAIEGLMSRSGHPMSDALLMHAVRLLTGNLGSKDHLDDPQVRSDLLYAAMMCGQGTDHTGSGVIAVLGHAIGARSHIENGLANAVMLPHALRFNAEAGVAGLEKIATALGIATVGDDPAERVISALETVSLALGLPRRLRDIGVPQSMLADAAESGMADWFLRGNPRQVRDSAELRELLERAW